MTPRAVIFDMDGVLTDSEPVINAAAIAGLKEFGVTARPEDFLPFVGAGEDRYIGGVAELHGIPYTPAMKKRVYEIYLDILPGRVHAFPGVHRLLDELAAAGLKLAVASSADRIKVEANLSAIGIRLERFATLVVGDDVERKKPAPDIYLAAARNMGLPPDECCVIEDALNGVRAAKAAGMRCIAVEQSFPGAALRAAGPDLIRRGIADVSLADLGVRAGRKSVA
jgi:HAD superfamily hydrolase (TIGR01509 family)